MPNYCCGVISSTTERSKKSINTLAELLDDENKSFAKIILPMPKNIFQGGLGQEEKEKYGKNNWYDWSIAN